MSLNLMYAYDPVVCEACDEPTAPGRYVAEHPALDRAYLCAGCVLDVEPHSAAALMALNGLQTAALALPAEQRQDYLRTALHTVAALANRLIQSAELEALLP